MLAIRRLKLVRLGFLLSLDLVEFLGLYLLVLSTELQAQTGISFYERAFLSKTDDYLLSCLRVLLLLFLDPALAPEEFYFISIVTFLLDFSLVLLLFTIDCSCLDSSFI